MPVIKKKQGSLTLKLLTILSSNSKNTNICTMWCISSAAYRVVFPPKKPPFSEQSCEWEELRFLFNPLCVPPLSLRPLSPLPQFRRPSMTQFGPAREREGAGERLECFGGWDIPHCSFTQALCNADGSRDVALQQPWEAKALSPPQWLPRSKPDYASPVLTQQRTDGQADGRTGRSTDRARDRWKRRAERDR